MNKSNILPQFFCQVLAKEYACHMSTFVWWKIDEKSRVRNGIKYPSVTKGILAFAERDDDDGDNKDADDKDDDDDDDDNEDDNDDDDDTDKDKDNDDDDDDDVQYVNKGCKHLPSNVFADRSRS